jgi:hypothetical protein
MFSVSALYLQPLLPLGLMIVQQHTSRLEQGRVGFMSLTGEVVVSPRVAVSIVFTSVTGPGRKSRTFPPPINDRARSPVSPKTLPSRYHEHPFAIVLDEAVVVAPCKGLLFGLNRTWLTYRG